MPGGDDFTRRRHVTENTSLACDAGEHGVVDALFAGGARIGNRYALEPPVDRLTQR